MSDHRELDIVDQNEIDSLTDRVTKKIGRRELMTGAAKAIAFTVPASMITGIPTDALAAGSPRRAKKKAKRKVAKKKVAKKKAKRKVTKKKAARKVTKKR